MPSMEDVIAMEDEIRAWLKTTKSSHASPDQQQKVLIDDAIAIMTGRPTKVKGTRADRLRQIVEQIRGAP